MMTIFLSTEITRGYVIFMQQSGLTWVNRKSKEGNRHQDCSLTENVIQSHLFDPQNSITSMGPQQRGPSVQIVLDRPSAQILPFPVRLAQPRLAQDNRLSMMDRIHALEWAAAHASPAGARLEFHGQQADNGPEIGDYIGIYRAHEPWLVWGAARDGDTITVWHGPNGSDFGTFDSMKDALAALCAKSIQPRASTAR
jgi:hypothetical protein